MMISKLEEIRDKLINTSKDEILVRALIVGDEYVESKEEVETKIKSTQESI